MIDVTKKAPARWTPEEEDRLAEAYTNGQSIKDIAEAHGRSASAITSRLGMLDLISYGAYTAFITDPEADDNAHENAGKAWSDADIAQLMVLFHTSVGREAEDVPALAAKLGRTPRSLALKLVQMGLVMPELNPNPQPKARPEPKAKAVKEKKLVTSSGPAQKITVTPEFQAAARVIGDGEHALVLGSAGTGKSTFLRYLKKLLAGGGNMPAKRYVVLAPTGMAALNVGGQTVHSFFGFKPGILTPDSLPRPRQPKLYEKLDVLILDEISMVRADMFEAIDGFLRAHGPKKGKPFGGVQLCLIGDLFQLPPIVTREEQDYFETTFDSPYFFSSKAFRNLPVRVVEFTQVFRQNDIPFVDLLTNIRHGWKTAETLDKINLRLLPADEPVPNLPTLTARVAVAERANQEALASLPGSAKVYRGKLTAGFDEKALPAPLELTLKVGARVMFTKNDTNQRWVNGTLGEVTKLGTDFVTVLADDGETHVVEPVSWERTRFQVDSAGEGLVAESAGSFTQIPLALAWALTIHKSQGQTLPGAVVDLSGGGAFAEGQLYVALSRTRSLESLHLRHPISPRDVRTHQAVKAFYNALPQA